MVGLDKEPVDCYSYTEYKQGITLQEFIKGRSLACLMLDRYDLYNGEFLREIDTLSKTCTVLIDCKGQIDMQYELCNIILSKRSIEVTNDEDCCGIHRKLVDRHNSLCDNYSKVDTDAPGKYRKIHYMY